MHLFPSLLADPNPLNTVLRWVHLLGFTIKLAYPEEVNTVWQKHTSPPRCEIDFLQSRKPDRGRADAAHFNKKKIVSKMCQFSAVSWRSMECGGDISWFTARWTQISSWCGRSPGWASAAGKHPGCKTHCWMPVRKEDLSHVSLRHTVTESQTTCAHKHHIFLKCWSAQLLMLLMCSKN